MIFCQLGRAQSCVRSSRVWQALKGGYEVVEERPARAKGARRDQIITIRAKHPEVDEQAVQLRRIEFVDDQGKVCVFLTNRLDLAATTIAEIYRQRWHIELFFKAIKQNLRSKTFVGTSENALHIQIWTAPERHSHAALSSAQLHLGMVAVEPDRHDPSQPLPLPRPAQVTQMIRSHLPVSAPPTANSHSLFETAAAPGGVVLVRRSLVLQLTHSLAARSRVSRRFGQQWFTDEGEQYRRVGTGGRGRGWGFLLGLGWT
jgi:Transposase DDE domain